MLDFVIEEEKEEISSYYSLDLSPSNNDKLTAFFDHENNKFLFARKYIEICQTENFVVPEWISEIKRFFLN